jgi:uncharacterized protein (TIGR02466 family)
MSIDNLFSVPVITVSIDDQIISNTLFKVHKFISNPNNKSLIDQNPREGNVITTYRLDQKRNFLGQIGDQVLLSIINGECRKFFNILGLNPDCYLEITSWLQLNPPNSSFNRHEHFGAILSGVVYLETPENCGDLSFYNPNPLRAQALAHFEGSMKEENFYNFSQIKVKPVRGNMIIFESYLQHSVGINQSSADRIAISFNVWIKDGKD